MAMSPRELSERIRRFAVEAGFDKVGFARVDRVHDANLLHIWLGRGYHADMAWMERNTDVRTDPRNWYADAVSVVCVGLNYYTPHATPDDPNVGKISRYAWGDDYHEVMKERLLQLLERIKTLDTGIDGRVACDTSPVMDKYWAVLSGIGWQGKHSNVLTRDLGSWLFLGEIFVNVELEPDRPMDDYCGSCTACIDACPTEAIVGEYLVDARKCLSYWTIEYRGSELPQNIAERSENWIYGCDICQDVCPWNQRFSRTTPVDAFQPREENVDLPLHAWSQMTEEEFRTRFRNSPVKRAKWKGMERNAESVRRVR
jgi:epoxyqueuosine reductase